MRGGRSVIYRDIINVIATGFACSACRKLLFLRYVLDFDLAANYGRSVDISFDEW